jgi:alpha-1,2-rhamnosyltransferase
VDCTNTFYDDPNTGIQRVVRNIIDRCPVHVGDVEFVPVFASFGKFYSYKLTKHNPLVLTKTINRLLGNIRNALDGLFAAAPVRKRLCNSSGHESLIGNREIIHSQIISSAQEIVPFILKLSFAIDRKLFNIREICIGPDDVLFLPDVFWNALLIDALKKNDKSGAVNILLIHDIFPILYPQFADEGNVDGFMRHISYIFTWADGVMSVSRSSLDEIRKYGTMLGEYPQYDYFHPGADFSRDNEPIGPVRSTLAKFFEGSATYLMVGTVEPRKNHQYVLEAFKKLWKRSEKVKLCIIGKIGWKCRDIIEEINSSPMLDLSLIMVNDASDAELQYSYTHAKATIIASVAEGFGLPLVEALHFENMVFASDIPVFHELGNDAPIFFSLDSPDSLVEKIIEFQNSCHCVDRKQIATQNWDVSVNDLFRKVISMSASIRTQRLLSESETLEAS